MSFFENLQREQLDDQDTFEPAPPTDGERIHCIVKWFNPIKGFGFVMPEGEEEDIFLHFSVLDSAGYQYLSPDDEIDCIVGQGRKGRQVGQILGVTPAQNSDDTDQGFPQKPNLQPVGQLEQMDGEVKWFNTIRGFGFVTPEEGGRDVFVHASVLRRIGLQKVNPGQRVRMQVTSSDRGRQAWALDVLD